MLLIPKEGLPIKLWATYNEIKNKGSVSIKNVDKEILRLIREHDTVFNVCDGKVLLV